MKANEFVKKFGWEISIDVSKTIQKSSWVDVRVGGWWSREFVELPELKRLVESHELIKRFHGVEKAKYELKLIEDGSIFRCCVAITAEMLKQAIADVEACQ